VELPAICQCLVELAKERGGADNITCIVLRALETTPAA
jgi:serine/threonine protein phosphatase PrpC